MSESLVQLMAALPAEAKPVISQYKLKRVLPDRGFPVYRNQHISLVVSGVGKANAAAACAFLHALNNFPKNAIWINLGIAGHGRRAVGDALLAHHIRDASSGRQWYPPLAFKPPCPSDSLETRDYPDTSYEHGHAIDMEASGFYPIALLFSTEELVHCFKVISDNPGQPGHGIKAKTVRILIGNQLDPLDKLLARLGQLANLLRESRVPDEVRERYRRHCRYSKSQDHLLDELLSRWQIREPDSELWLPQLDSIHKARPLLALLRRHLDGLAVLL